MSIYRTIDGDMVDAICFSHYGDEQMTVAVYEANPHLAALGAVLPMGVLVTLPEAISAVTRAPVRLW